MKKAFLIVILFGLILSTYSYVAVLQFDSNWSDFLNAIAPKEKGMSSAEICQFEKTSVLLKKDWYIVLYVGVFISLIGCVLLAAAKYHSKNERDKM